jgi:hypothetical protein
MADVKGFNSTVAARTRAAEQLLGKADLLAAFVELGGTAADLEPIRDAGREAEAFNQAQGAMQSNGKLATLSVLQSFADVQRDYVLLLAVLRAIRGRLLEADPKDADARRLEDIIANRAAVTVLEGKDDGAPKKASRSKAQENVRAEIERDLVDLLGFQAVSSNLTARGWTASRLNKLLADARSFSGKLGDRAATKGASKEATKAEQLAVSRQSQAWAAAYPLLSTLGRMDARVRALLTEARR